jgi:hypothetical protein
MADPSVPKAGQTGPLAAGVILQNRYRVGRLLGGGGMGMVYLAHDQRLSNRPCAIKEMVDHFIDPAQRLEANEYFAREADTLAQLKHPAIPAITDRFDDANRHYLVMEYVEGRNLEEELAANGGEPLSEGLAIDIARQLCDVLAYLHGFAPPIVYRDMKPSNVMLTPKGRAVLIDFGIARLFKGARKGTMIGTLGFAPPEQYQGQVDPRSDIYSLGATLHYTLSGRDPEKYPPFSFPPMRSLRPEISSNLAAAIDSALAYKVEERPVSIQAFRDLMLYGHGATAPGRVEVSSKSGTADLAAARAAAADYIELTAPGRRRGFGLRRVAGFLVFVVILGATAFGATYLYSDPELQVKYGLKPLFDSLPWKHEELVAQAREHPLEFQSVALALSTREGASLSSPKTSFLDSEIANDQYLKWSASFKNALAGIEGRTDKVEARFFDPDGAQVAASEANRFVGPDDKTADFGAVALIPNINQYPKGTYKIGLFLGDQRLAEQTFSINVDTTAQAKAAAEREAADAAAKAEAKRQADEQKRLAMIEERRAHPLELADIRFLNTTKTGTPLSGPAESFSASKVLFLGWEATFKNRLYNLDQNQYRVDAAYIAPDGRTLGSVDDVRNVPQSFKTVTFSGRVGNSAGGAFLPGAYSVSFYLNGQFLAQKQFRILADTGLPPSYGGRGGGSVAPMTTSLDTPVLASGRINGLLGADGVPIELRLRPQANGFLRGELIIEKPGFGTSGIDGFVRGDRLQFQTVYGGDHRTYFFEGKRRADMFTGSFQDDANRSQGTWTAHAE